MNQDNRIYYENFDWNEAALDVKLREKVEFIQNSIPSDVNSIVDVGCGDGSITNNLSDSFIIFATDRSINALTTINTERFCSSADHIPLANESFDLVLSSEMIEHLPEEVFRKAIAEFKRISKKYIFLTFPNDENIEKNFVKCPECYNIFNKVYHLRKINLLKIKDLFPDYEIKFAKNFGKEIRKYNRHLARIKHSFVNPNAWIPKSWVNGNRQNTLCPKCSFKFTIQNKFSFLGFLLDGINTLISPKIPYQLFVLLKKKDVQ